MSRQITNKLINCQVKKKFAFKREKGVTWRKSYAMFENGYYIGSGYSSKKEVKKTIARNYKVKQKNVIVRDYQKNH